LPDVLEGVLWGVLVGVSLLAGALLAARLRLSQAASSALTAFGGGLLLSAVALELVPEADAEAGAAITALGLLGGTAVYVLADRRLHRDPEMGEMRDAVHAAKSGRMMMEPERMKEGRSLAAGLLIDGVPESLALGLTVAEGELGLALLAGVLAGNVVEAYGAGRLIGAGAVRLFTMIGAGLAVMTVLGATVLSDASPSFIGGAQAVAAGAVLAVISITIVPDTFRDIERRVAVAMILGFTAGYLLS
jgi:zinc transporter, ZIP family